ncbi:tRNA isopentenyl-2-thiomethyl-A-37 hydroxylase MiaE [Pseudoalteromonas sp. MSK9-3]
MDELLHPIKQFLQCETPQTWIDVAIEPENLSIVLIDHLICEQKCILRKR